MTDPSGYPPPDPQQPYPGSGGEPSRYGQPEWGRPAYGQPAPGDPASGQGGYGPPPYGAAEPGQPPAHGGAQYPGEPPYPGGAGYGGYEAPQYGYGVPQHGGYPGGGYPPGGYPADPLVVPPGAGFSGWLAKLQEVGRRSWRSALLIALIGVAAPSALLSLLSGATNTVQFMTPSFSSTTSVLTGTGAAVGGGLLMVVAAFGVAFLTAAAWAAGIWALTQEAATGQQVRLGDAFRYGFRRALPLWGWTLLVTLIVVVGICACILPGVYFGFALSLYAFVVVFERGENPIVRSFRLTHADFGPTLGRVALLFAVTLLYRVVIGLVTSVFGVVSAGVGGAMSPMLTGVVDAVIAVLGAPTLALMLVGLYVTYAELRAREVPLSTPQLQAAL